MCLCSVYIYMEHIYMFHLIPSHFFPFSFLLDIFVKLLLSSI